MTVREVLTDYSHAYAERDAAAFTFGFRARYTWCKAIEDTLGCDPVACLPFTAEDWAPFLERKAKLSEAKKRKLADYRRQRRENQRQIRKYMRAMSTEEMMRQHQREMDVIRLREFERTERRQARPEHFLDILEAEKRRVTVEEGQVNKTWIYVAAFGSRITLGWFEWIKGSEKEYESWHRIS